MMMNGNVFSTPDTVLAREVLVAVLCFFFVKI